MSTILQYDNITTLFEDINNAPAGNIVVVMPLGANAFQTSVIALRVAQAGYNVGPELLGGFEDNFTFNVDTTT